MNEKRLELEALTEAYFQPHIGQVFRMRLNASEQMELTLREVRAHTYAPPSQKRRGFSILFRSAFPKPAPQAIYTLAHDEMGTMDLFLVPTGLQDGGVCYEAVFN